MTTPLLPVPPDTAGPRTLAELAAAVAGPVLTPDDPALAAEVASFNAGCVHRPAVVVGATCTADVAAAVRFAAHAGLPVAVQATGHGAVTPVEGALLVATSRMQACSVDPVGATATVGAGVRWSTVLGAAAPHGLAPLSGSSSHVGAVGYTLGGGLGPLGRKHGFAADQVRAVEVVTADGVVRRVDAESDPDLFWAVRGGKGSFGIVTEMTVGLVPVPRLVGGGIYFPGDSAPALLQAWRTWAPGLPEETSTSIALLRLPPLPFVPEPLRGRLCVHLRFVHLGTPAEADRLLAPMRAASGGAPAILDAVADMPYTAVDSVHQDPSDPLPFWEQGALLGSLPAEAVDALLDVAGPGRDVPLVMAELRLLGGALARPAVPANAVAGRGAAYSLFALGVTPDPQGLAAVEAAGRGLLAAVEPWRHGERLVNFLGHCDPADVARAWPAETAARLAQLKRRYDPARLFRFGHVVAPAPAALPVQSRGSR